MRPKQILGFMAAGLLAGAFAGAFGVGGGILFVPTLLMVFRKRPHDATVTSLAIIVPTALIGAATYNHKLWAEFGHGIDWAVVAFVSAGAMLGSALIGVPLASRISGKALKRCFGVLLCLVGLKMLFLPEFGGGIGHSALVVLAAGLLIGTVSGFFGVGGGIVAVPLLVMMFGMTQRFAQGTSIAMTLPTALAGVVRAHFSKEVSVDLRAAALMAPMSMVGSGAAAALAGGTPDRTLQCGFAVMLILTALHIAGLFDWVGARCRAARPVEPAAKSEPAEIPGG